MMCVCVYIMSLGSRRGRHMVFAWIDMMNKGHGELCLFVDNVFVSWQQVTSMEGVALGKKQNVAWFDN